jgi:hypothetical protein
MAEENLKQIDIQAHNREFGTAYGTAKLASGVYSNNWGLKT